MRPISAALILLALTVCVLGCKKRPAATDPDDQTSGTPSGDSKSGTPSSSKGLGTFTIGKSTTYVTGPVDASGHIDYAAALNERLSKGVTPENNANVAIWKVLGPKPTDGKPVGPEFFAKMKMEVLPVSGDYYVSLRKHARDPQTGASGAGELGDEALSRYSQRPWTANENPKLHAWVTRNDKHLTAIAEAAKQTHYYSPLIPETDAKGSKGLISSLL